MTSEKIPLGSEQDDLLISMCSLLEALLVEVKRGNNVERTGAVSSVEIKFLANGTPQPVVKCHAGSEPPVDEAIESFGRVYRVAKERQMSDWQGTADALRVVP
jgi:hypothetical protein